MLSKLKNILNSDNGVVLLGNISASAFGLGIFMLLARSMDKSSFGYWAIFISTAGLLDLMRTGLVRQGMVRAVATTKGNQPEIISSAGVIALIISFLSALVVFLINISIDLSDSALKLFFEFYPLLSIVSLPWNFSTWYLHANGQYKKMNALRLYVNVVFILFIAVGYFLSFGLYHFAWGFMLANGVTSLYALWQLRHISWKSASKPKIKELLHYGKHSLATLTGSNLLKSADNLIIGSLMGTEAVAIFAIPMKALDLMEIPLRGFVMTAFRKLSQFHAEEKMEAFRKLLLSNIKQLTALCIPVGLAMLILPKLILQVLGGNGYEESTNILRILSVPLILLPLDKFLGASLDSIGKPRVNAIKVWIMVIANIVGDVLVIWLFDSLLLVAAVTILNIIAGIVFALIYHPYFSRSTVWNSDPNQKSMVNFQSAKTPANS